MQSGTRQASLVRSVLPCILLSTCIAPHVVANTAWADLLRQQPDLSLQHIESATVSLTVLKHASTSPNVRGTIVVLPAEHQHAFSPNLLNTLRTKLPSAGWDLIVLPPPETVLAAQPTDVLSLQKNQLSARWQMLFSQNTLRQPVVSVAQGEVAILLQLLIQENSITAPAALVNLGPYLSDYQQQQQLTWQVTIPVLDLIIASDHPHAVGSTADTATTLRRQYPLYRHRYLNDVSHHPTTQVWLTNEILGWLGTSGF